MNFYRLGTFDFKDMYDFQELPKGVLFALSMNPYNGNVFVKFEKHETSSVIALEIMRQIVRECDEKFPNSADALRDYARFRDRGAELESLSFGAWGEEVGEDKETRGVAPFAR